MSIKIIRKDDPIEVKNIVVTISAQPGGGKTTMASGADKALLLDFDRGAHRAKVFCERVEVWSWADVESMTREDLAPFNTIINDTVGRVSDRLAELIATEDPKNRVYGGGLSLQGYGILKTRYATWASKVMSWGKDIINLAHIEEKERGGVTVDRIDMLGSSKNEVYKISDAMGRIVIVQARNETEKNPWKRGDVKLLFSPSDYAYGKNPAEFGTLTVPFCEDDPNFIAKVIQQLKDAMTRQAAASQSAVSEIDKLREIMGGFETLEDWNGMVAFLAKAPAPHRHLLVKSGEAAGFVWDKAAKAFTAPKALPPVADREPGSDDDVDEIFAPSYASETFPAVDPGNVGEPVRSCKRHGEFTGTMCSACGEELRGMMGGAS